MKIAVVGCGALGSFYGAKLRRAGHEVHFLLRSDYEVVRVHGVRIRSIEGNFHVQPKAADRPEAIGPSELVLIGLKTTANDQFARLLPPLVDARTILLTLQNGLGNEEALARLFPPEQILGGLAFVCLNRIQPGLIHHTDHGRIVIGEYQRPPLPRTQELAACFQAARVPCEVTDNLARAHWEKLVWNVPFNGLGVAGVAGYDAVMQGRLPGDVPPRPCLPTDELLADARWERLVRDLMAEIISSAAGIGFEIPSAWADVLVERTRTMGAYRASTLLDFEAGRPLELESLFLQPLRQACAAGRAAPRLAAMCEVLKQLENLNRERAKQNSGLRRVPNGAATASC
jgi:2-dehydropantoate 2-reductase